MTPLRDSFWPQPDDLERDPVLAILAALDATIVIAIRALIAAHPYVNDDERPYWVKPELSPSDRVAPDIVMIARRLLDALESYRNAIVLKHRPSPDDSPQDDFPF